MCQEEGHRKVAVDAAVLINILHIDRLDLLTSLPPYEFLLPEPVIAEITGESQIERLQAFIQGGEITVERITAPVELALYATYQKILGKGEASCLALAKSRTWYVASDEKGRFLRTVREDLGENRILNTPGLLLHAIRTEVISVEEADNWKEVLEANRFRMTFASFRDLLGDTPDGTS